MIKGPMPWDMVVFLSVTTLGFAFTVQKVTQKQATAHAASEIIVRENVDLARATVGKQTMDLGCVEKRLTGEHITSEAGTIRVKGKFCSLSHKQMHGFDGIRVKNLTNGYESTIFFQGYDASFVTDYLALTSGKNLIQVEWRESQQAPPHVFVAEVFEK